MGTTDRVPGPAPHPEGHSRPESSDCGVWDWTAAGAPAAHVPTPDPGTVSLSWKMKGCVPRIQGRCPARQLSLGDLVVGSWRSREHTQATCTPPHAPGGGQHSSGAQGARGTALGLTAEQTAESYVP